MGGGELLPLPQDILGHRMYGSGPVGLGQVGIHLSQSSLLKTYFDPTDENTHFLFVSEFLCAGKSAQKNVSVKNSQSIGK